MALVRPNLTERERDLLTSLLSERLSALHFGDVEFKELYLLFLKVEKAKVINT